MTSEYFIHYMTFPAPFVGDSGDCYREAESPEAALLALAERSASSVAIYSAHAFASADDYHKRRSPLARYASNRAKAERKCTSLRFMGWENNGKDCLLEVDGHMTLVENAREGGIE